MKKFLGKSWTLRLFCVAMSFALWFFVVQLENPITRKTFYNIPVNTEDKGEKLQSNGLTLVNDDEPVMVNVVVEGRRTAIAGLNSDTIAASLDYSGISQEGDVTLPINVSFQDKTLKEISVNRDTITVSIKKFTNKTLQINIVTKGELPNGYMVGNKNANPNQVVIEGPTSELEKIASAEVIVDISNAKGKIVFQSKYELLDFYGDTIKSANLLKEVEDITATVEVNKVKKVPVILDYSNTAKGLNMDSVTKTVEPESITISGYDYVVDLIDEIKLPPIDISRQEGRKEYTLDILMPEGVNNMSNVQKAEVTITVPEANKELVQVPTEKFTITNKPGNWTVEVLTTVMDIYVRGLPDIISTITADNIIGTLDLSKITAKGTYMLPINVELDDAFRNRADVLGEQIVTIAIK